MGISQDRADGRFAELDGLRALAAAGIVAYQTFRVALPPRTGATAPLARIAADGSQGLTLFLLVSGFALAYPLLATLRAGDHARIDVGRYAAGRALRIYPAYLATLALAAALHPLALLFAYPALAHATPSPTLAALARCVLMGGDGLGNDGLRAVAPFAGAYLAFPLVFALWMRAPRVVIGSALAAAFFDAFSPAHGWDAGAVLPFVLGIAAADLRARRSRAQHYGLAAAALGATVALICEPRLATLPGALAAPSALRIDPFWSFALFGLLIAAGAYPSLRAVLGLAPLRAAGAASYAITLVAMPVAAFAARDLPAALGYPTIAAVAAASALIAGFALWHAVDRPFANRATRDAAAARPARVLDRMLGLRYANVTFEPPRRPHPAGRAPSKIVAARPAGELAVVTSRTGTADQMAAEIAALKRRLREPGAATLAEIAREARPASSLGPSPAGAPTLAHLWSAGRNGMRLPSTAPLRVAPTLRVIKDGDDA